MLTVVQDLLITHPVITDNEYQALSKPSNAPPPLSPTYYYTMNQSSSNDLLSAIRKDIELHKFEQQTQVEKKEQQFGTDKASIISRCIAFELSDSDSGSDDRDDSDRWND